MICALNKGNTMGNIIVIMGKSASGKDTIYHRLITEMHELHPVVSYTTRPIRVGEKDGIEYHFVTDEEYLQLLEAGKILENREYDTCYGIWRYFTCMMDVPKQNEIYIMIATPEAYEKIEHRYGRGVVQGIYITLDSGERLQRALNRERKQEEPRYKEMCRRFIADEEDFSEEKMRKLQSVTTFENNNLEKCLQEIKAFLENLR